MMPDSVFQRLAAVDPKYHLVFDEKGIADLTENDRSVLRPEFAEDPPKKGTIGPGTNIRFTNKAPERDRVDAYTFDFLDASLRRANDEGIRFFEEPATPNSYFLVILGIGLGLHIEPLIKKTNGLSIILIEPEIEFLWHSLETCDWIKLIGDVQAQDGYVDFIFADDANEISGNIWRTIRRTNPCSADGFTCFVHHHSHLAKSVMADLTKKASLVFSGLGFFYDETLMMWNTFQNLEAANAKIYQRTPDQKRQAPVFVIGSGPSLDASFDVIRENAENAVIVSCGSALRPLILNGIQPDFQIEMENFGVSPLVSQVARDHNLSSICLLVSSTIDPGALDSFDDIVFFFRHSLSTFPLFCDSDESSLQQGGPTVVNAGLSFAQESGFREIYLFGVDMGAHETEKHHAKDSHHFTPESAEVELPEVAKMEVNEFHIPLKANFGGELKATPGLVFARAALIGAIGKFGEDRKYFNCSDGAFIDGAIPTRPESLSLKKKGADKRLTINEIKTGYAPYPSDRLKDCLKGDVLSREIEGYMDGVIASLREIENFEDKRYMTRLMGLLKPELGYAAPPPKGPATTACMLFRGTLMAMLIFFEYYLARVGEREKVEVMGGIMREEFINRLDELKETAIATLCGPKLKKPPPVTSITAAADRNFPELLRISRNEACPCGSGRKFKQCHGAVRS